MKDDIYLLFLYCLMIFQVRVDSISSICRISIRPFENPMANLSVDTHSAQTLANGMKTIDTSKKVHMDTAESTVRDNQEEA